MPERKSKWRPANGAADIDLEIAEEYIARREESLTRRAVDQCASSIMRQMAGRRYYARCLNAGRFPIRRQGRRALVCGQHLYSVILRS